MKKSLILALHLGFWSCYFVVIVLLLAVSLRNDADTSRLGYYFKIFLAFAILPSILTFYSFYIGLFPFYLRTKNVMKTFFYGVLLSYAAASLGFALMYNVSEDDCSKEESLKLVGMVLLAITFMAILAFLIGIAALVIKGFITWFEEVKLKEQLQEKNHAMEMALVKSQLDPHFLFNTINNIDVMIVKNPNTASEYLNKLSDIMRFMLYETKSDKILLINEVEYIGKYIALQKIRTANANYVTFSQSGEMKQQRIAPMLFIPFIENAFKHTTNKKMKNAIVIHLQITGEKITFTCENKISPNVKEQEQEQDHGLGNELIKKRLELLYPNQHQLHINHQNDLYSVNLTLNHG